jgi:hypothetical protein
MTASRCKLPLILAGALRVGAALPAGWTVATSSPQAAKRTASFDEINVGPVNIVEPTASTTW